MHRYFSLCDLLCSAFVYHGDSAGEFGGVDQIQGESAKEVEEEEQDVREDGQELQREGGDPKPEGEEAHPPDSQGRRPTWQEQPLLRRIHHLCLFSVAV